MDLDIQYLGSSLHT